jgi:hypothetical protein
VIGVDVERDFQLARQDPLHDPVLAVENEDPRLRMEEDFACAAAVPPFIETSWKAFTNATTSCFEIGMLASCYSGLMPSATIRGIRIFFSTS